MHRQSVIIFILLFLIISFPACRVRRPVRYRSSQPAVSVSGEASARAYIDKYKKLAVTEMIRTGVPASITLAQGMIESDYGRSTLATRGNNHFGIKCHNNWRGPVIYHDDDRKNDCFRKYPSVEDSFYDHSDFLKNGVRYSSLFDLNLTDYKGWARGLKKAGYATNPDYANMLIRKIEENNLQYYDTPAAIRELSTGRAVVSDNNTKKREPEATPSPEPVHREPVAAAAGANTAWVINDHFTVSARVSRVMENNRIQYIIVKDGESLEMIEDEFQLLRWELQRYNEFYDGYIPEAGQIIYLQPKRDKAEVGKETHIVIEGETLYSISQQYGVKIKKLREYNTLGEEEEPVAGQIIWLRKSKPLN